MSHRRSAVITAFVCFAGLFWICGASCPPPVAVCGNGICEAGEDATTCPTDCGAPPVAVCGNGICEAREDAANCPADCGTAATFTDGDGYPELTGPPLISSPIAITPQWSDIEVTIPYDADTRYVRLAIKDFNTSTMLIQNWAQVVGAGGGSIKATVSFNPNPSWTPPDTYYLTFDLCSSVACSNPFKRTTYERTGTGTTYTRVGYVSPPLTQSDGPRDAGITIPTFTLP